MLYPVSYKSEGGLQTMTSAEFETVANHVLEYFADDDGPGNIYASNPGSRTLIGSITDTSYAGNVGEGNTTIISNVYDIYQDLNSPVLVDDMPAVLVYDTNRSALRLTTTSEIDAFAANILNYGVNNEGPGSYVISTTTPVGGTWSALGVLNDVVSNVTSTVGYTLYKKIAANSYTLNRPIKVSTTGSIVNLQRLSDTELNYLTTRVRQKIIDTGVGQYVFQETAPVTGTWVDKGTVVDSRPTTTSSSYLNDYTSVEDTNYEVAISYTGTAYTGDYVGDSGGIYTGVTPVSYAGPASYVNENAAFFVLPGVTYSGPVAYTGDNATNFTLTYLGPVAYTNEDGSSFTVPGVTYSGPVAYTNEANFTSFQTFGGGTYTGDDVSPFVAFFPYSGPITYLGDNGPIFQSAILSYFGPNTFGTFTLYTGPGNNAYFNAVYTGGDQNFTALYTGAGGVYTGFNTGPGGGLTFFNDPGVYAFAYYNNTDLFSFVSPSYTSAVGFNTFGDTTFYTGDNVITFTAGGENYTGPSSFTNPDGATFTTAATYSGPLPWVDIQQYTTFILYTGPSTFTNPNGTFFSSAPITYSGPSTFTNTDGATFIITYSGPSPFTNPDGATFTSAPITYSGPSTFTNVDGTGFTGFVPANYTGAATFSAAFDSTFVGASLYVGTFGGTYDSVPEFLSGPTSYTDSSVFQNLYVGFTYYTGYLSADNYISGDYTRDDIYTGITPYTGPTASYVSSFEGATYTGPSGYTGPSAPNLYTTGYNIDIINNPNSPAVYTDPTDTNTYTGIATEIVTTKKLWRRIA